MEDESVRQGLQNYLSIRLRSFHARITVDVLDSFTSSQSLEAIENALLVFNLKCEIEKSLSVLSDVSAALAYHDRASLTAKHILEKVFLRCGFNWVLQAVEDNVKEFLCVLLLPRVSGFVIEVLEREAELSWVVVLPLR